MNQRNEADNSDTVFRLRTCSKAYPAKLLDEAADEIEKLRDKLRKYEREERE